MQGTIEVVAAVPTIGSPDGCRRAIAGLLSQQVPRGVRLTVLVVNNNAVLMPLALPLTVAVIHEPRQGVSSARNAAVQFAMARSADVLAFLDDDEEPADTRWLARLVAALDELDCEVTTGPVVSVFGSAAPAWITTQSVFHRKRCPTGTRRTEAATNNIAFRLDVFGDDGSPFEEALNLIGGEDTHLTRRLAADGARIRWVDEAVVIEHVPASRLTGRWVLRRSWRIGSGRAQRLHAGVPGETCVPKVVVGSLLEITLGITIALLCVLASRRIALAAAGRAARGLGCLFGLAGFRHLEYSGRGGAVASRSASPADGSPTRSLPDH